MNPVILDEPGTVPRTQGMYRDDGEVLQRVLAENVKDYMSLAMFTHYVASFSGLTTSQGPRSIVIDHIASALDAGLISVGDLTGAGHQRWRCSPAETLTRVSTAWPESTPEPAFETLQDICWLINTQAGDEYATAHSSAIQCSPPSASDGAVPTRATPVASSNPDEV